MASLLTQSVNMTMPDGEVAQVPLGAVDTNTRMMVVKSIAYGVEMGASVVMLAIILTMTPKPKFCRFPTYLNIAALCNNIVRVLLLAIYFESSWVSFYSLYSGDRASVTSADLASTIASTVLTIPQNIMMMLALVLQAWVMVRLWPEIYRWAIIFVSVVLVLLEVGFMGASEAYQIMLMYMTDAESIRINMAYLWVRYCYLGLEVACIAWFCVLFSSQLVTHLWKNRSFLPTAKGLGAMDVLVMTNGVLMLFPVLLAGLQYSWTIEWEAGSMVYTSVIIGLPLGTLVAQRIAEPAAFNSDLSGSARISNSTRDRFQNYAANKSGLLKPTWSESDKSSSPFSRQTGVTSMVTSRGAMTPADIELARIDADIEGGKVRVDHEIKRLEEVHSPVHVMMPAPDLNRVTFSS